MDPYTPKFRAILLLGLTSLVLGMVSVALFFERAPGLNYPLFVLCSVGAGMTLARTFSYLPSREQWCVLGAGVFFSLMVYLRSSDMLTFFNVVGSALLLLASVALCTGRSLRSYLPLDYLKIPLTPFYFIRPFLVTLANLLSLGALANKHSRAKEVIRGSIMAALALTLFAWLFASGDVLFGQLMSNLITFEISDELFGRILFATIVSAFFVGAFSFIFVTRHTDTPVTSTPHTRGLGVLETQILLGSVCALFLFFILLQATYLFGGASHLLSEGLTYAQYAREGFVELVCVAVLACVLILFTARQVAQADGAHTRSFKFLCAVLVVEVIAILASAFMRLSLYEQAYGFTTVRLFSHGFMVWLAVVLIALSLHIWKDTRDSVFAFQVFCSVLIFLAIMNVVNPDAFIAKANLARYANEDIIDVQYLAGLSGDALPYTITLLNDPNEEVRTSFARSLLTRYYDCTSDNCMRKRADAPWQESRWNSKTTTALLDAHKDELLAQKDAPDVFIEYIQ